MSKELRRNRKRNSYRPKQAQEMASRTNSNKASCPRKLRGDLRLEVGRRILKRHSPEQISGALRLENILLSHETIYKHLVWDRLGGGLLYRQLRINGKRRNKHRSKASREKIPNRVGISERPMVAEKRQRYGDWEVDLVEGTKGSGFIVSYYERKSRLALFGKLDTKQAKSTAEKMAELLQRYKVKTLTYDNGLEFSQHEQVSAALGGKPTSVNLTVPGKKEELRTSTAY